MSVTDAMSRLAYGLCNMSSWTSSNDADCVSIAAAFADPAPIDEAWLRENVPSDDCAWWSDGRFYLKTPTGPLLIMNPTRGGLLGILWGLKLGPFADGLGMEVRG